MDTIPCDKAACIESIVRAESLFCCDNEYFVYCRLPPLTECDIRNMPGCHRHIPTLLGGGARNFAIIILGGEVIRQPVVR